MQRHRSWSLVSSALAPLVLLFAAPLVQADDRPAAAPSGWRVIWASDPATKATISWNTRESGDEHSVYLDTDPLDGDPSEASRQIEAQRNGRYSGELRGDGDLHYHHARLTNLKPATEYYFMIESDGHRSPPMHFRTAPKVDGPLRLLFGGDSRSNPDIRRQVNRMIGKLTDEHSNLIAFIHGGDYIVRGTNLDQWHQWMNDHELTTSDEGRILPIVPARGNHDRGPMFNEIFDFPEDDRNYYAMNVGSEIRLITLNTETSAAGDQKRWLERELKQARPKHRWVIVQYHRPAWPAVKGPSSAKQHWVPLFEQYNVDLACEADGHNIKRTPPIRDEEVDPTGITYIGEGGLGVGQRTPKIEDRWWLQAPGKAGRGHHVHLLSMDAEHLDIRVLLLNGETFDHHTLTPR